MSAQLLTIRCLSRDPRDTVVMLDGVELPVVSVKLEINRELLLATVQLEIAVDGEFRVVERVFESPATESSP